MQPNANVFSIDVEEWFHILETDSLEADFKAWDQYTPRAEASFDIILDVLRKNNTRVTMFFLGWIAEKYPEMVRKALADGHEIAAHGYYHKMIRDQDYNAFFEEMRNTKLILEDITGKKVIGYRAPGFSLTRHTVWAYKALMELGFEYSSSVYPASRAHGSFDQFGMEPRVVRYKGKSMVEFPMTILRKPFTQLSCFGGGYFRLFPLFWYRQAAKSVKKDGRMLIFYLHPREVDIEAPKLDLPLHRHIKCYVNVKNTAKKVDSILQDHPFTSFEDVLSTLDISALPTSDLHMDRGYQNAHLTKGVSPTRKSRVPAARRA